MPRNAEMWYSDAIECLQAQVVQSIGCMYSNRFGTEAYGQASHVKAWQRRIAVGILRHAAESKAADAVKFFLSNRERGPAIAFLEALRSSQENAQKEG